MEYVCKGCGEEFDSMGLLGAHTRWKHNSKLVSRNASASKEELQATEQVEVREPVPIENKAFDNTGAQLPNGTGTIGSVPYAGYKQANATAATYLLATLRNQQAQYQGHYPDYNLQTYNTPKEGEYDKVIVAAIAGGLVIGGVALICKLWKDSQKK